MRANLDDIDRFASEVVSKVPPILLEEQVSTISTLRWLGNFGHGDKWMGLL